MNPSQLDLPTIGGGLGIMAAMVWVLRLTFKRLDTQDSGWQSLLTAAERRADSAEKNLAAFREHITAEQQKDRKEMQRLAEELSVAKMKIYENQHVIEDLKQRYHGDDQ